MDLNIIIDSKDLETLDDQELFLKLYESIKDRHDILISEQDLTEEITRAINLGRGRKICRICDGFAFLADMPCFECRGRGHE